MKNIIFLLVFFLAAGLLVGYLAAWNDGQYVENKFNYLTERDRLKHDLDILKAEQNAEQQKEVIQAISQLTPGLIAFSIAAVVIAAAVVIIQWLKTRPVNNQVKTVVIYRTSTPEPTRPIRMVERLAPGQEPIEVIIPERSVVNVQK